MPCGAVMDSLPLGLVARLCSSSAVRSISSSRAPLRSSSSWPASVSDTCRVVRLNRRTPKRFSSWAMYLLTLAGDMSVARAAAAKLPRWATSRKVWMRSSESMGRAGQGWAARGTRVRGLQRSSGAM